MRYPQKSWNDNLNFVKRLFAAFLYQNNLYQALELKHMIN